MKQQNMIALVLLMLLPLQASLAQTLSPREVPAKSLPVPGTASPAVQKMIAAPLTPTWNIIPTTADGWREQVAAGAAATEKTIPSLLEKLQVKVEPILIDGVKAFSVTPALISPQNKDRLLIHVHGGCFVSSPGLSGTVEAIYMAGLEHIKVISVDYRMPPDHPYPAALDDAMKVWSATTKTHDPKKMGIFGSSAGGNLTLAMVLRAKRDKLPLPAAIAPGTPMSDLTGAGDSFQTNHMVDNVLVAFGANCDMRAALYTNGHDPKDPMLSPVYGDFAGFPPTILTTGTRDLLLSNTVRVHRKLRNAGVPSSLQVFEGQSHAQYYRDINAPETKEAFSEIGLFFNHYLER